MTKGIMAREDGRIIAEAASDLADKALMWKKRALDAEAVLASRQHAGVEGYVVVPREPTEEMLREAAKSRGYSDIPPHDDWLTVWSAMIAAAPATDEGEAPC